MNFRPDRRRTLTVVIVLAAGIVAVFWTQRRIIDQRFEGTWALNGWWGEDDLFVTLNSDGAGRFKTSKYQSHATIEWWVAGNRFCIDHRPHVGLTRKIEMFVQSLRGGPSPISSMKIVEARDGEIHLEAEDGTPVTMSRVDP